MVTGLMTAEDILAEYKDDVYKLAEYIPWLEKKYGKAVSSNYSQDGLNDHSVSFPVYDGTLMSFIKLAETTKMMDRNYRYVYTRNNLHSTADEHDFIEKATIHQMDQIAGIISYYVIGGRTKGILWSQGVTSGVFYKALLKAKELIDVQINATVVKGDN